MAYTLAIVDEGLLDLTRFRTPELGRRLRPGSVGREYMGFV